MSKIELKASELQEDCINNIKYVIYELNKIISYFDYFDVPYNFSKRLTLKDFKSDVNDIIKDLNGIKSWICNSNNDYNTIISTLNDRTKNLSTSTIKSRNQIM